MGGFCNKQNINEKNWDGLAILSFHLIRSNIRPKRPKSINTPNSPDNNRSIMETKVLFM